MGVSAKFKIDSEANVAPIKTMQAELAKIPELLKAFHTAAQSIVPAFQSASAKIISVASETEQKVSEVKKAATAKVKQIVENETQTIIDAAKRAALLKSKAEQDYVALKSEYVLKGLDVTRQAIHEEEQKVKASRDAISRANQEHLDKDAVAVLKAERDKQNARLQGLRSVEKEITGARTFSEQLEKNVYEPINKEAAKGGALTKLLFGEVGALQKKLKETEAQVATHESQIATHAKESTEKIEAQEREHAAKLKQLEEQIATAKNATAKKELEEVKRSIEQQVAEERKLTQAKAAEEQLQLQHHQATLEKELNETKAEHAKASSGGESKGVGLGQVAAIGVAVEGAKKLIELTEEESAADSRLTAATGLQGEALEKAKESAEELGHQYKIGGAAGKEAMAAVGSFTHATGDLLKQQTEDAIILAQKMGTSTEAAAKLLGKAGDPEVAGNLKKLGINLDANASADERAAAVHVAAMKAKDGVDRANDTASKNFNETLMEGKEIVAGYASTFLDLLNPALKIIMPILPELVLAIGAITIAMNAQSIAAKATAIYNGALTVVTAIQTAATWALNAAMAVNPFVWIGLAIVALIAIVVLLIKHWDEVVATTKKVFSAIMDAGGAVLSFLGITSKAEAATRKHTDSLKDNKKSLEDIKKAEEDAAKATSDYTDSLKKNSEEQEKSAKDGQDNAIAAIVDIQHRLKTATGSEKAALEERLSQWQSYGKKQVANAEEIETAKHAASLSIGAAADKEDTASAKKAAKSKEEIAKSSAEMLLNEAKENIASQDLTDKQAKTQTTAAEIAHQQTMLDIARQFHGERSKQYASESKKLQALTVTLKKDERAQILADNQSDTDDLISELEIRGAREGYTEKRIAKEKFDIQQRALRAEITLRESFGEDVSKLTAQFNVNSVKQQAEAAKEAKGIAEELRKDEIESEKDGLKKKLDQIAFEREHELANADLTEQQIAAIKKKYRKEETDAFIEDQREKQEAAKQYMEKGIELLSGTWEERGAKIKEFLLQEAKQLAMNEASKLVAVNASQAAQTALTAAGFIARNATYIAEGIASAASAAGTWIATAAKAAYNAFESLPFPLDIVAALAAVGGVAAIASQVPKLFGGHADGTDSSPGGMKWVGERGPELMNVPKGAQIIPNHHLPNLGAPAIDLSPVLHSLNMIHAGINRSNETFSRRQAPGVLIANDAARSAWNAGIKAEDRRSA